MPHKKCDICGKRITVKVSEWKYLDKGGEFAHHLPCVMQWIGKFGEIPRVKIRTHFYGVNDGYGYVKPAENRPFRSKYEEYFVAKVDPVMPLLFEAVEFRWGTKTYTPDFYFFNHGCFVEIKGLWMPSQRSKYKSFRKEFPDVRLLVIPWISRKEYYEADTIGATDGS